jgi:alpha-L-fucosidase
MSHHANLLLNFAPDRTGRLPDEAAETMRQVAEQIRS